MCDLKGVEIHDLAGLSAPLTKLIETVSNAIGKVYEPLHIKRIAQAKAKEISIISSTINDNLQLPTKYDDGQIVIDTTNANELLQRAQTRFLYQELKNQQNIESVIGNAYNELLSVNSVSPNPVDDDWIMRLFQIVKDISSEEMQLVWGKILAGEIVRPGSFSLRTLDAIRNITKQDAEAFQKILPLIMTANQKEFIIESKEILSRLGITFESILKLDECGLIRSETLVLKTSVTDLLDRVLFNKDMLIAIKGKKAEETDVSLGICALTRVGSELYRTLNCDTNNEYYFALAEEISKKDRGIVVSVHKVNFIDEDGVDYEDNPLKIFGVEDGEPS